MKRRPPVSGPVSYGRAGDVLDPGERPGGPSTVHDPMAWRLVRGALALAAVLAGAVVAVRGAWLWTGYRPDGGDDVERALADYGQAWIVLALVSTAWLGVALVSTPTARRVLATGALVALAGAALVAWTAPQLAWDSVVLRSVSDGDVEGLIVDGDADRYVVGGEEYEASTYEALVIAHVVGAALVASGLLTGGLLARARRRRPDPFAVAGPPLH